jgi:pilus assembly protein Flp/PilA
MQNLVEKFTPEVAEASDDEGAAMVEYGLLIAFIALIALVGVKLVGTSLNTLFTNIANAL